MSQKRKLEDYQDPDYQQFNEIKKKKITPLTEGDKIEKIQTIVRKEFQRELTDKELEISKIESRLLHAKQLLHRVRYAIVANFYKKKGLELQEDDLKKNNDQIINNDQTTMFQTDQKAIHPSLKKLLGKKPVDYDEILKMRPMRQAAKTAKTSISEKLKKKKDQKKQMKTENIVVDHVIDECIDNTNGDRLKVPRYIEPIQIIKKIPTLNSSRGRNQIRHLIVVGNTSKYIGDEKSSDGVTHKWLVYVRTKTDIPIEEFVTKVRFFLHPSYKPNDVIDVTSPPFQLSRRGWGEFPVRIQLYFNNKTQQKPLQLIHTLVLDRKHTGLQTMGAETIVEMYLNSIHHQEMPFIKFEPPLVLENNEQQQQQTSLDICNKLNSPYLSENGVLTNFDISKSNLLHNYNSNNLFEQQDFDHTNNDILSNLNGKTTNDLTEIFDWNNLNGRNINEKNSVSSENCFKQNSTKIIQNNNQQTLHSIKTEIIEENDDKLLLQRNIIKLNLNKILTNGTNALSSTINDESSSQISYIKMEKSDKQTECLNEEIIYANSGNFNNNNHNNNSQLNNIPFINNNINNSNVNEEKQIKTIGNDTINKLKKNQIIKKNGEIYIVDPLQMKYKQQKTKQMSLLKPQSILKPINKNELSRHNSIDDIIITRFIHTDHDYAKTTTNVHESSTTTINNNDNNKYQQIIKTNNHSNNKIITFKRINQNDFNKELTTTNNLTKICYGTKKQHLNKFTTQQTSLEMTKSIFPSKSKKAFLNGSGSGSGAVTKPKLNYFKILETCFNQINFQTQRGAIEYLLKKIPLVSSLIKLDSNFKISFPFIVDCDETYFKMTLIKQRSFEWLRAKMLNKMLKKHNNFKFIKEQLWTTKEIILFARKFAYIPMKQMNNNVLIQENNLNNENSNFKEIIKNEIKREKFNDVTLTFNNDIYEWINDANINRLNTLVNDEVIINIDDDDYDDDDDDKNKTNNIFHNRLKYQNNLENSINHNNNNSYHNKLKLLIPLPSNIEKEGQFISELTEDIGIRLKAEEIITDVIYPTSSHLMVTVLRSFTENLVRLAYSRSASTDNIIQPVDIKNALLNRPEFDFLTNKNMGVPIIKDQIE